MGDGGARGVRRWCGGGGMLAWGGSAGARVGCGGCACGCPCGGCGGLGLVAVTAGWRTARGGSALVYSYASWFSPVCCGGVSPRWSRLGMWRACLDDCGSTYAFLHSYRRRKRTTTHLGYVHCAWPATASVARASGCMHLFLLWSERRPVRCVHGDGGWRVYHMLDACHATVFGSGGTQWLPPSSLYLCMTRPCAQATGFEPSPERETDTTFLLFSPRRTKIDRVPGLPPLDAPHSDVSGGAVAAAPPPLCAGDVASIDQEMRGKSSLLGLQCSAGRPPRQRCPALESVERGWTTPRTTRPTV